VTHTLAFVGTDLANNQDALFLDNVTISPSLSTTVALPVLTQNTLPATAATVVGDSVTFTAAFSPAPPATYQWQFISTNNGVIANIPGATNSTLTLNNLQLTNSGFYRLAAINATNSQGVMFSGTSPLTVTTVPGAVNNVIASYAAQTGLGSVQPNFAPTWTVTPGSVIAGQSPSSVGAGNFSLAGGGVVSVLTDGTAGSINLYGAGSLTEVMCGNAYGAGQSVTYTLTNSLSPSGYNLTNIVVYGGWGDAGRDQQAYTVYYAKATAPTSFIQLGVVNFNPVNAAGVQSATRATLTPAAGVLASNVVAVMIDFTTPGVENGFVGYSEIDLYGASVLPLSAPAPAASSANGSSPSRTGVTGDIFNPSAGQLASETAASCRAKSSASLHFARSTIQLAVLPAFVPLAVAIPFGSVTRNSARISPFFFCRSARPGTIPMPVSSFISAYRAAASMPLTPFTTSAPPAIFNDSWWARPYGLASSALMLLNSAVMSVVTSPLSAFCCFTVTVKSFPEKNFRASASLSGG